MKRDILNLAREAIDRHRMLTHGDTVITAISGGADSTALLIILTQLREEYGVSVEAAHVNHGLRGGESKRDEKHAVALARTLGLNVHVTHVNIKNVAKRDKISVQEAGRKVRDGFFRKILAVSGAAGIATGHTLDDNVETFLMRLIAGSGPQGLSGISPCDPPYIRPLIDVSRREIEEFLLERGVSWVEDSSNRSDAYTRNRIRSKIVPPLLEINPRARENIAGAVARLREMYESMDAAAAVLADPECSASAVSTRVLDELPDGMKKEVVKKLIYGALHDGEQPLRIDEVHINTVCRLAAGPCRGERSVDLPGGLRAVRTYDRLEIAPTDLKNAPGRPVLIEVPGSTALDGWRATITAEFIEPKRDTKKRPTAALDEPFPDTDRSNETAYLDADLLDAPLSVRTRLPGDRISPGGGVGSKKLKDYFIDLKVAKSQRDFIPIVACGEIPVWVVGFTVDRRFQVTEKTERILKLSFIPMDT